MQKRAIVMFFIILIPGIIQLVGLRYIGTIDSEHDIEFYYDYSWRLSGIGGWYSDYDEIMEVHGHYIVDFDGKVAKVKGDVSWRWENFSDGDLDDWEEDTETYRFTYSLKNGTYLKGTDQEEINTTGLNVWFHIPKFSLEKNRYWILDDKYYMRGETTAWVGGIMPYNAIRLYRTGEFKRDDVYGSFNATYTTEEYFTEDGYLIGELYTEEDEGYDRASGYWARFKVTSVVIVTSSSYPRTFNYSSFFWAYWSWILVIFVLFYVVYEVWRWGTHSFTVQSKRTADIEKMFVQKKFPSQLEFDFTSVYKDIIQAFIVRERAQKSLIVSVHNKEVIKGIGFIERKGKIGTFFGSYIKELVKYSGVKYAFIEKGRVPFYVDVEKYDVYEINDIQNLEFDYDASIVNPATEDFLPAIARMIAYEDHGKKKPRYVKWVAGSVKNDIGIIATASKDEEWIRQVLNTIDTKKYPKPEIVNGKVLLGVGFISPSKESGWLYGLYVHPAFRNSGIGKTLVMARLDTIKEIGSTKAITEIAEWNGPAKRIYKKLDAKIIGNMKLVGKKLPKVKIRRH